MTASIRTRPAELVDGLSKLVATGLIRPTFASTELVGLLSAGYPGRSTEQWYELAYRAIAGAGSAAAATELPSDPRYLAARKLFGIESGLTGASAATRRDEASRHLRDRRPRDPYLDVDAPLSGRQQRVKLQGLLQLIASDLHKLADESPAAVVSSKALYDVAAVDYTVHCDEDGCPIEKIEDWTITANRRLTHFPKTWALGSRDPAGLEIHCIGGQLAKTYDRQAGVLITEVLFGEPLAPGNERTIRFVTRFIGNSQPERHLTARSTRPARRLRVRLQLPPDAVISAAPIAQREDYDDSIFSSLSRKLTVDSCGYTEVSFSDMLPDWNYGIAWSLPRV